MVVASDDTARAAPGAGRGGSALDFAAAVALLRSLPRPLHQPELLGFLAVVRARRTVRAAIAYAGRKREQVARSDRRVEQQFWARVQDTLALLPKVEADSALDRQLGLDAQSFAQHLVAENYLRRVLAEQTARRAERPSAAVARSGGEHGG